MSRSDKNFKVQLKMHSIALIKLFGFFFCEIATTFCTIRSR